MRLPKRNPLTDRRRVLHRTLRLEVLRERVVLDGSGLGSTDPLPWFDPGALTYSFAPDGTSVAGEESQLFEELSPLGEPAQWKTEFDAAFNAWLAPLGSGIHEVADSGSRFGVSGRTQGDARFGDIRIAAVPLTRGVLATSVPHNAMVQGTWAGDILINANATWSSRQEIFAVALHEFGHVLGLGHSIDPLSPMFVHGVADATAPTATDILELQDLYVGIQFEVDDDDDSDADGAPTSGVPEAEESEEGEYVSTFPFDPTSAVALTPAIGTTLRYTALGNVANATSSVIYRLDPTLNEPEGLENLTLTLQSTGTGRLIADIAVFDSQGKEVESTVLHHGQGRVVVQAQSVESDEVHYVRITSSPVAPAAAKSGDFEIVMDLVPEIRLSRQFAELTLDQEKPALDIPFNVASSRLVHIHLDSEGETDFQTAIFAQLIDDSGNVLTQIVIRPGTGRSAPLSFLSAGDYTLRFFAGSEAEVIPETKLTVYLDEVSIDVGPGIIDPTGTPYVACDEPGADPNLCYAYTPITPNPATIPNPAPEAVGTTYPWWWEYGFSCSDYGPSEFVSVQQNDPLWWDFYVEACQPATPPPVTPPPVTPPPVTPPPVTPPPTTPPPVTPPPTTPSVSAWQNQQNPHDVSANQQVTALDALMVINVLGRSSGQSVTVTDTATGVFADVNGDFFVSGLDALMVINQLARDRVAAEGEAIAVRSETGATLDSRRDTNQQLATDAAIGTLF